MQLAILFWFYKEPVVCLNHLKILRHHNPDSKIYGLFAGNIDEADNFREQLSSLLDDFYVFNKFYDSYWKWRNGDLIISEWFRGRGKDLLWDTVFVVQWDMLVIEKIDIIFPTLKRDQIVLSLLTQLNVNKSNWLWIHTNNPDKRNEFPAFLEFIQKKYGYNSAPHSCGFIVVCFPRVFLESYSHIEQPELGFLEYKVPMYAQIFGINFCEDHAFTFKGWDQSVINAVNVEVSDARIGKELLKSNGARVFHPYWHPAPLNSASSLQWVGAWIRHFSFKNMFKRFKQSKFILSLRNIVSN